MEPLPIDVSVIIPTFGRPYMLARALDSVLAQTHSNFEVIIVIDGDDPITLATLKGCHDSRVHVIALQQSVGGSEARNLGARAARGRYIALLDDDDEWLPAKLELQLSLADAQSTKNFVVVTQYIHRTPGQEDEVWPGHLPGKKEMLSEFLFSSRGGFQTSTYLCPRSLFLAHPFKVGLKKHQDWDWFLRIKSCPGFRLLVVPEPLSIYWVPARSANSVSRKLDWRFSAEWARDRLPLMTRRAYSAFLVKMALRAAIIQGDRAPALRTLLRQILFVGNPSAATLLDLIVTTVISETLRQRIRGAWSSWSTPRFHARLEDGKA
jgi:glycosyltransferase involved in cell wall biosynthesis